MFVVMMLQVQIGTHSFTFDHVYGSSGSPSSAMFEECIAPLVDGLFQGYNATVLAYGQVKLYLPWETCSSKRNITYAVQFSFPYCHFSSGTDRIWEDIYNGNWLQRWLPDRNNSSSHECFV